MSQAEFSYDHVAQHDGLKNGLANAVLGNAVSETTDIARLASGLKEIQDEDIVPMEHFATGALAAELLRKAKGIDATSSRNRRVDAPGAEPTTPEAKEHPWVSVEL